MATRFHCRSCGEWHDEVPLDLGFDEPLYVAELNADDRARFVTSWSDFRTLLRDGATHHFIRGVIEIPIHEVERPFRYGVWASLSQASYKAATKAYKDDAEAGPFFGWLSNRLALYPDTLTLKANVHVRATMRARIELEPTDHPLAIEQRDGITMERVQQIVDRALHPPS